MIVYPKKKIIKRIYEEDETMGAMANSLSSLCGYYSVSL